MIAEDLTYLPINETVKIERAEIEFRFASSSGPGGQHVNKRATKAILRFDVAQSPSLSEAERALILERLAGYIDSQGVLQIQAQSMRSQWQNRESALARLQVLLTNALRVSKPRKKSKPSHTAVEKRLQLKRQQGQKKQARQKVWSD